MVVEVLGWVGALVVLAAYALFSLGRLPNGPLYQVLNLVGGACVAVNVASHGAWPSTIVNGIWAVIAVVVLAGMLRRRRATGTTGAAGMAVVPVVTGPVPVLPEAPVTVRDAARVPEPIAPATAAPSTAAAATAAAASVPEPAPLTGPVPLVDAVAVVTGAIAVIALAAAQHAEDAASSSPARVDRASD